MRHWSVNTERCLRTNCNEENKGGDLGVNVVDEVRTKKNLKRKKSRLLEGEDQRLLEYRDSSRGTCVTPRPAMMILLQQNKNKASHAKP